MLDEEVVFANVRKVPKNKGLDSAIDAVGIVGVVAAGVGGYLGALHGLDFNKFFSLFLGGSVGLGIGAGVAMKIEDVVSQVRQTSYDRKQQKLDDDALNNGAQTVSVSYRGNELSLVLRPEFEETGNFFYMSVDDGVIKSPKLSYQPKRDKPLKFSFGFPEFVKANPDGLKLSHLRLKAIQVGINPNQAVQQYLESAQKDAKVELEYAHVVQRVVSSCSENFNPGEKLDFEFFREKKILGTRIEYTGENYGSRLALFGRCASELMNQAYDFRATHEFN